MSNLPLLDVGVEPYPGYRLRRLLGQGAFGSVWEAEGPGNRRVALKFLPCDQGLNASDEQRSIQVVRHLNHPNLLPIDHVWCNPGYLVIGMELADGTLLDLLQAHRDEYGTPIGAEHLCPLLGQAAAALDFLNTRQHTVQEQCVAIQHCDVKPTNLLLCGEVVKVSDFSLTSVTTSLMRKHRCAGTTDYMAPEVFQGRLSDRTDQYALAVTYYMLRTGRLPFEPATFSRSYVRPPPNLDPLTDGERMVIGRALAPLAMDRWPSCGEMMAQLRRHLALPPEAQAKAAPHAANQMRARLDNERRRSMRHSCQMALSCRLLGKSGEGLLDATLVDVSRRGLGIVSKVRFERGAILVVQLGEITERFAQPLVVRVVRVVRDEKGWLCGCTFARRLGDDELQALLGAAVLA